MLHMLYRKLHTDLQYSNMANNLGDCAHTNLVWPRRVKGSGRRRVVKLNGGKMKKEMRRVGNRVRKLQRRGITAAPAKETLVKPDSAKETQTHLKCLSKFIYVLYNTILLSMSMSTQQFMQTCNRCRTRLECSDYTRSYFAIFELSENQLEES